MRWLGLFLGALAVGVVLHWHGLGAGLALDDYLQLDMLSGAYPVTRSALNLYDFVDGARDFPALLETGTMPWWSDPQLRLSALRPLSSALIVLDVHALGGEPLARHAHSLFWWALLVTSVFATIDALVGRRVAIVATVAFVSDPAHVVPIAWLANRAALVSGALGAIALLAHHRWRSGAGPPALVVSAVAFAASLLAGEYGLGAFGYLVGYELLLGGDVRSRLRALAPAGLSVAAWLVARAVLGYGAHGSSGYLDPFDTPSTFLLHGLARLPALLVNELLTVPSEATHLALVFGHWAALVLIAPLALFVWLAPGAFARLAEKPRRGALALGVGAVLSLIPLVPSVPSGRLLVVPSIGGAAFVAVLLVDAWEGLDRRNPGRRTGWARRTACGVLALLHLVLAPAATHLASRMWAESQRFVRRHYLAAPLDDASLPAQRVVVLNALDPNTLIFPPHVLRFAGRPAPRSWHVLTMTPHALRITRTSLTAVELAVDSDEGMLEVPTALFFRAASLPLTVGDVVRVAGMEMEVLALGRWGPTRLACRFDTPLESASRVFLMLTPQGIVRAPVPQTEVPLVLPSLEQWASMAATRP